MPYESKPMKKQWVEVDGKMTPIILPQIWSHEKQDWVVTSEQNPLPTQVTGSIVEHKGHEAVAITNTTPVNSGLIDVSKLIYKYIHVRNDLDVDVEIGISVYTEIPSSNFINTLGTDLSYVVEANTKYAITSFDMPILDTLVHSVRIRAQVKAIPTSGTLSTWLIGGR